MDSKLDIWGLGKSTLFARDMIQAHTGFFLHQD